VASLVFSLLGLITLGVGSIVGVILGHVILPATRAGRLGGYGLAVAGLIVGWFGILVWSFFWLPHFWFIVFGVS
jgi:hypothetical protein